jgi:hypothetical protein
MVLLETDFVRFKLMRNSAANFSPMNPRILQLEDVGAERSHLVEQPALG